MNCNYANPELLRSPVEISNRNPIGNSDRNPIGKMAAGSYWILIRISDLNPVATSLHSSVEN